MTKFTEKVHDSILKIACINTADVMKKEIMQYKYRLERMQGEMHNLLEEFISSSQDITQDLGVEKEYYSNFLNHCLEENGTFEAMNDIEEIAINIVREKKIILAEKDFNIEKYVDEKLTKSVDITNEILKKLKSMSEKKTTDEEKNNFEEDTNKEFEITFDFDDSIFDK